MSKLTPRQNVINIIKRKGIASVPIDFNMTPYVSKQFTEYVKKNKYKVPASPFGHIYCRRFKRMTDEFCRSLYSFKLKEDTIFDEYGVAQEAGSADCNHLRRFYHPLKHAETIEELKAYPYPHYKKGVTIFHKIAASAIKGSGRFLLGNMQCTSWEQAWYLRGMEELMMDMIAEPDMANFILDKVTENAITDAENYALAGCDAIFLGDDVGMQNALLLSEELYVEYLKPRLKRVIDAARKIKPDLIVFYHSCGYVEPLIEHFIDAGVDVLNPVQPESMDFKQVHDKYGDRISFLGSLGTQTTMPFGSQDDVARVVKENLDYAGAKGGLLICPTHILEPEVPVENIIAYIEACKSYKV